MSTESDMVKTPSQMRNMVEDWLKVTGVKYQDTTAKIQEKNPEVQWQFLFGNSTHITKIKKRDDRIVIHSSIGFSKEIVDGMQKLGDQGMARLVNGINEMSSLSGLTCKWILKDKMISGFEIPTYVDEEELNRPTVFKTLDNVSRITGLVAKRIILQANPTGVKDVGETSDKQMYT